MIQCTQGGGLPAPKSAQTTASSLVPAGTSFHVSGGESAVVFPLGNLNGALAEIGFGFGVVKFAFPPGDDHAGEAVTQDIY